MSDSEKASRGGPPRDLLGWSVAATVLCFLPLGLVAVAQSLRTRRAIGAGRDTDARRLSRVTRRWLVGTVATGIALWLGLGLSVSLLGSFSA